MKKNIIRIEHISGKGVFRAQDDDENDIIRKHSCFDKIFARHSFSNEFPTYYADKELFGKTFLNLNFKISEYNFAFKSLDQLDTAFTRSELKELIKDLNFKVLMLDVTNYYESEYQVIFKKSSIIHLRDISSMFL